MVALARPAYDYLTLRQVGRVLGVGNEKLSEVINRPDFPKEVDPGHWRRKHVEAWCDTPRCLYGNENNPCWEERDPADNYQLGMCPEHTRLAHNIMRQHRVARLTHA